MASQIMSPRLPGVRVLTPNTTGPQYSRWRREVQIAFTAKGTWAHCDGTCPMPMPESGPTFFSPATASNPQPELLEERRSWVKKDRDVKMDLFLSVADDIKVEVFEVGPPLPPSAMTAKEMIEALDEHYGRAFVFEDYHHVFCHFLNLHIDQFADIAEFNAEFTATLEDLLDHGQALANAQACSAYFSKLRCTQNPWVATKLKEWDTLSEAPKVEDLMKECPPWMINGIRPLSLKPSHSSVPDEDLMGPPSIKEEEEEEGVLSDTDKSESAASARSSVSHSRNPSTQSLKRSATSHSRKSSNQSLKLAASHARTPSQELSTSHSRTFSEKSEEITVGAGVDDIHSFQGLSAFPLPGRQAAKAPNSKTKHMSSRPDIPNLAPAAPPPINRPLPPIPASSLRTRSSSPKVKHSKPPKPEPTKPEPFITLTPPRPQGNQNPSSPPANPEAPKRPTRPTSSHSPFPSTLATPSLTPDLQRRPSSSRDATPAKKPFISSPSSGRDWISQTRSTPHLRRHDSNDSSIISLPLQGSPEYRDTIMSSTGAQVQYQVRHSANTSTSSTTSNQSGYQSSYQSSNYLSTSPPRSLMARLSAELNDDEKRSRKRSWSLKARLSGRRLEVREMI